MAAAYFHLNDANRLAMNNADAWGPQYATYAKCMTNLRDARSAAATYNNYDMILNAAYNAGTYSRILGDYFRICAGEFGTGAEATQVKAIGDYSLSDSAYQQAIGTAESAGSTFILYPRQVRLYLDELYNQRTYPPGRSPERVASTCPPRTSPPCSPTRWEPWPTSTQAAPTAT